LCPACRQAYSENPADFKPLTSEELAKIKADKRQKDQAKKQKISENRKHLANVRVVQKNLVFVVGLSPRLADPEILKKPDYFGKFGKIHKVVINHSTQYAGSQIQGPSASAYVTYFKSEDALRAIQAVNNIFIDGRTLKASLGTTKYCSHFMKNQTCPKNDCMYLHELGDDCASFTKEQMQQGKHTEYEKNLHDEMLAGLSLSPPSPTGDLGEDSRGDSGGRVDQGDWSVRSGGVMPEWGGRGEPDQWSSGGRVTGGGGEVTDWGGRGQGGGAGDQSWPDLGQGVRSSRFISSKDDDKSSKSKSSESSEEETSSVEKDSVDDQVVPSVSEPEVQVEPVSTLANLGTPVRQRTAVIRQVQEIQQEIEEEEEEEEVQQIVQETSNDSGGRDLTSPGSGNAGYLSGGWLENDMKISNNTFFDDDVDDLGFDPFHETQKGLADLLESESKAAEAQLNFKVATPEPDWSVSVSGTQVPTSSGRARLPPPGFHNPSVSQPPNLHGSYLGQGVNVDSLFGPPRGVGGRPAPGFGQPSSPQDLLFGLGKGGDGRTGLDTRLGDLARLGLSDNRLSMGLDRGTINDPARLMFEQKQQGQHLNHNIGGHHDTGFSSKDWQDGLRALLPNANISFGNQNHSGPGLGSGGLGLTNGGLGLGNSVGPGGLGLGNSSGHGGLGLGNSGGHGGLGLGNSGGHGGLGLGNGGPAGLGLGNGGPAGLGLGNNGPAGLGLGNNGQAGLGLGNNGPAGLGLGNNGPAGLGLGNNGPAGMGLGNNVPGGLGMGNNSHSGLGLGNGGAPGLGNNSGIPNQGLGHHFGLQNNYQGSFGQERLQHNSNWGGSMPNGSGLGNDWTMLDPAIVTGQLAPPSNLPDLSNFRSGPDTRSDSPPNWITANLEQLTAEPGSPYNSAGNTGGLIPAFNGLGMGSGQANRSGRGLGWGAGSTATPPPGFSHHRQSGVQGGYPAFGALNKNNEVPKIGEF